MSITIKPSRSRPRRRIAETALLLVAAFAALPTCSHDSYLAITLRSDGASFAAITEVEVDVMASTGQPMATRVFDVGGTTGVTIDATMSKSLSLSFTPDRSGTVIVKVAVFNSTACLGAGTATATIDKGGVAQATVTLTAAGCNLTTDAGVDAAATAFPGCDPATAGACPAPQTCYVDCANRMNTCAPGGTKGPGETCASTDECAPGTQCIDFGCATVTRACLKFCAGDGDCAALSTDAGTSTCRDPVVCSGATTTYKTCGLACDPRGTATVGCPSGLNCFLFSDPSGGQDSPSCGCPVSTRVGTDGARCTGPNDCAPGFICDQMSAGVSCRRLCKMNSAGDCPSGQSCAALTNNTVFGVCI